MLWKYSLFLMLMLASLSGWGGNRVVFEYQLENRSSNALAEVSFWALLPLSSALRPDTIQVDSPLSHSLELGVNGQRKIHFKNLQFAPYATQRLRFSLYWQSFSKRKSEKSDFETFLSVTPSWLDTDRDAIRQLAQQLKGQTPLDTMSNIGRWMSLHLSRAPYAPKSLGAHYALANKKGDCTEYMYLAISLARLNGIPARGIAGFLANSAQHARNMAYHNWLEVFVDGYWRPWDIHSGKGFLPSNNQYLPMMVLPLSPKSDRPQIRFSVSNDRVRIDSAPY